MWLASCDWLVISQNWLSCNKVTICEVQHTAPMNEDLKVIVR